MLHSQWESHVKRLSKLEALSTAAQNVMELTVKAVHCTEVGLRLNRPVFSRAMLNTNRRGVHCLLWMPSATCCWRRRASCASRTGTR